MAKQNPIVLRMKELEDEMKHRFEVLEEQMRQVYVNEASNSGSQQQEQDELSKTRQELYRTKEHVLELQERLEKFEQKVKEEYDIFVDMFKSIDFNKEEKLISFCVADNTVGVRLLIDMGVTTESKGSALHCAAEAGCVGVVQVLVDNGAHVNATDIEENTPLHVAAQNGQVEVCKLLVQAKAGVNLGTTYGKTALHLAAGQGHMDVCSYLITAGAEVNAGDNHQHSALHLAADNGHTEVCRLLLSSGALVNVLTDRKRTPLHWAAWCGHLSVIKLLVEFHADTSLKDSDGKTALQEAVRGENTEVADYLRGMSINHRVIVDL